MNIRDIAKQTGVSSTTVSRVLNQSGYVKEDTRKKILEAISETGYVPNAIARSLSVRGTSSIAVIVPDITNEFFPSLVSGISVLAEAENYNLVLYDTNESGEREHNALAGVESQYMAGVIITPVSEQDGVTSRRLTELREKNIPVVLADRDIAGAELDGVFTDNIKGSFEGVEALIREGHRRIAIIAGPSTSLPGRDRLTGYRQALEHYRIPLREEYIVFGDFRIDKAYEGTKALMALQEPPTAIFTSNNKTTLGALKYFTEQHIRIGRDISIIGYDQIDALKLIDYPLSTIERDAQLQGQEAMRLLLRQLKHRGSGSERKQIYVPHSVFLRGSEKCRELVL